MSDPSTTSYLPFDPSALPIFSADRTNNYLAIASIMLLLYDHVITLDKEVDWIWTLRWRLPKIIFIVNRYFVTSLILLNAIPNVIFPLTVSFCRAELALSWLPVLNFSTAEVLLIIRVSSLYGHRRLVVRSLGILFVLALICATVLQVLSIRESHVILAYKYLPGCWESNDAPVIDQWRIWICFLSVEGILVLLTTYKLFSFRGQMNRAVTVLARDSIVYFMIVFSSLAVILAQQVDNNILVDFRLPGTCMSSVAVGRMMMNIRGLIMEDPEHTIHLKTMQFDRPTNSEEETNTDAEIEEEARSNV